MLAPPRAVISRAAGVRVLVPPRTTTAGLYVEVG